jgi:hypothetical protein
MNMPELNELLTRFWTDLLARPSGPFAFRFVLQPLVAAAFAVRDGVRDASAGRSPYLWSVLREAGQRGARLAEGLKATARVIAFGVAIDAAYQLKALGTFYPGEAIVIAFVLGFVPYLVIRGPARRLARLWLDRKIRQTTG